MSFTPLEFKYTPPKTVPAKSPTPAPAIAPTPQTQGGTTNAGKIAAKLADLVAASDYLQSTILDRYRAKGVEVDFSRNPEVTQALTHLYGDNPPNLLSVGMYDHLLNAQSAGVLLEMASSGTGIEPNPVQAADVALLTSTIESFLIASGDYDNIVPTLLRPLKTDQAIFRSWQQSLATYPAYSAQSVDIMTLSPSAIQARSIDMSMGLFRYMDGLTNRFSKVYAGVYRSLAEVGQVERDINEVVNRYFLTPLDQVARVVGLFRALSGLVHKPRLQDLSDDLSNFAFARMSMELGGSLFDVDQLVQIAINPMKGALGSLDRIVSGVQGMSNEFGALVNGGLKGMMSQNPCSSSTRTSKGRKPNQPLIVPGLGAITEGEKMLAAKLDWAQREVRSHSDKLTKQFQRVSERRMGNHSDRSELMCSLRALNTLMGIGQGFINATQDGQAAPSQAPAQKAAAVSNILQNLKTDKQTTFIDEDGTVVISPPDIPTPPEDVQRVFGRGGIAAFRVALPSQKLVE